MDIFSILMFVAVGLAAAHVAHKTGEGEFALLPALNSRCYPRLSWVLPER
jgi:hypothetical protein